ncbi:MAG: thioredoxin 2 [Methanoregulaceae archaeon PtaB.Bin108]|nr:MAG: thioredoxin 2 [Methanoregulaceae archaeon PtaB.Bin108]OPY42632.1 MAG: thioredoxin 2 [Methanoregulaceae archaeon PtaU1.Bin222]
MEEVEPVEVTDITWEKTVEKSRMPVLVMFYSPTCPHCRTMDPYVRGFAREYTGIVLVVKVDITSSQWTAERFGVMSTPTFKFFCNGKPVSDMVGAVYPALIKRMIDEGIKNGHECLEHSSVIDYDVSGYA